MFMRSDLSCPVCSSNSVLDGTNPVTCVDVGHLQILESSENVEMFRLFIQVL